MLDNYTKLDELTDEEVREILKEERICVLEPRFVILNPDAKVRILVEE